MEYMIIQKVPTSLKKILWMLYFRMDEKEIILISNLLKSESSKIKAMKIFYEFTKSGYLEGEKKSAKTINYRYNELTKRVPQ